MQSGIVGSIFGSRGILRVLWGFFRTLLWTLVHIYREGNSCTDKLANHGHSVTSIFWWDVLPAFISQDIFRDRVTIFLITLFFYFLFEGSGLVSPLVRFSHFLIKFYEHGGRGWMWSWGANLIGMSCLLLMFSIAFESAKKQRFFKCFLYDITNAHVSNKHES